MSFFRKLFCKSFLASFLFFCVSIYWTSIFPRKVWKKISSKIIWNDLNYSTTGTFRIGTHGSSPSDCGPCAAGMRCHEGDPVPTLCDPGTDRRTPHGYWVIDLVMHCYSDRIDSAICFAPLSIVYFSSFVVLFFIYFLQTLILFAFTNVVSSLNPPSLFFSPSFSVFTSLSFHLLSIFLPLYPFTPVPPLSLSGQYCPQGQQPIDCPRHTYVATQGSKSLNDCLPCPAGYWCNSTGTPLHYMGHYVSLSV